jgi:hypothetical protein
MAKEISLSLYERNVKIYNRKGLRRTFSSIASHSNEYVSMPPLGTTNQLVFEVTIDKEFVDGLIKKLKKDKYKIIGSNNYFFIETLINNYELHKDQLKIDEKAIEAINKDLDNLIKTNKDFKEIENDDAVFYFVPQNEGVETLFEFIKTMKRKISKYAKDNDITIMMKAYGFSNQLDGFMGFNFFDADVTDKEVVVDYAASFTVGVDFSNALSVYQSGVLLRSIGESAEELSDKDINCHIMAENLKYEN